MDSYIIGSGGFAKEVLFLMSRTTIGTKTFKAFIDINGGDLMIGHQKFKVLEENEFLDRITDRPSVNIFIGLGDPKLSGKIISKFEGFNFPNLIDNGFVGDLESIVLGKGNIITAGCVFTSDINVGNFNIFNLNTTLGHDSFIGDFNVINPGVNISGGVNIGSKNLIGTGCTILQYLHIGNNSILGAGSVLTKNLEDNKLAVGVPAKPIKDL